VRQIEGNYVLKDNALLKDIFKKNATVADLRKALRLPPLVDLKTDF